jgi:DNA-binding transcriptional LysR family regulator
MFCKMICSERYYSDIQNNKKECAQMTLDQLRYFLEAAKVEHVGRAARAVSISPSAVSSAISALQKELGCKLFIKKGKNIQITDQGRYLKIKMQKLFDDLSGLSSELQENNPSLIGTFRLGGSPFLASQYLTAAWFTLRKKHPGLIGELWSAHTAKLRADLLSGHLDLALCFSPLRHPDLKIDHLYQGQFRIAVRKGHPILKEKMPLKRISEYSATVHKSATNIESGENHPVLDKFKIHSKASCYFDNYEIAKQSLITSDSWSLLPDCVIKAYSKNLVALPHPKEWDAPYTISTVVRQHRDSNAVLASLKENLTQELK